MSFKVTALSCLWLLLWSEPPAIDTVYDDGRGKRAVLRIIAPRAKQIFPRVVVGLLLLTYIRAEQIVIFSVN